MNSPLVSLFVYVCAFTLLATSLLAQDVASKPVNVCAACIRAHEEFLASDAMQGRGSATHDELVAATYVAAQLRQYGVEPAGDDGGYLQRAQTIRAKITAPPTLTVTPTDPSSAQAASIRWIYGKEFLVSYLTQTTFSGPLQKIEAGSTAAKINPGAVVLITGNGGDGEKEKGRLRKAASAAASGGAVAALVLSSKLDTPHFEAAAKKMPEMPAHLEGEPRGLGGDFNVLSLNEEAFHLLKATPDGATIRFEVSATEEKGFTWNAVGILRGRDPVLRKNVVLLSAHLDHLGIGTPVNGDDIYNGADDDASGTAATLELARVLGKATRPRRTVIFALFGSEELGGLGSTYFREHPPAELKNIVANLEFEMLGRADTAVKSDTVWLTGWERSNLGPILAAHGAKLVADPHPDQGFFARSDNYVLAKKGVVAQTVSSYGLHSDYHQPSDDIAHLDFKHMDKAIGSLLGSVQWLVNSDFTPQWNKGGRP
ncbi:MAG: M28 family peptidase [Acidobacteriota bacterium]|nr:M28 family peptidase [Acidobacteriota bacterium]